MNSRALQFIPLQGATGVGTLTRVLGYGSRRFRIAALQFNVTANGAGNAQGLVTLTKLGWDSITMGTPYVETSGQGTMNGFVGGHAVTNDQNVVGDGCSSPFALPDFWFDSEITLAVTSAGPGGDVVSKIGIWLEFEE